MTPFHFIILIAFVLTCIVVTYVNSIKALVLRTQRDALAKALLDIHELVSDDETREEIDMADGHTIMISITELTVVSKIAILAKKALVKAVLQADKVEK